MYKVTKDGKVLTVTDHLLHCKRQSNGVNVIAEDGEGVVVNGTIYNLPGYETVTIEEFSDVREFIGEMIDNNNSVNNIMLAIAELGQLITGGNT